eukprot:2420121-Pyramimonas_sp.AAC.1
MHGALAQDGSSLGQRIGILRPRRPQMEAGGQPRAAPPWSTRRSARLALQRPGASRSRSE